MSSGSWHVSTTCVPDRSSPSAEPLDSALDAGQAASSEGSERTPQVPTPGAFVCPGGGAHWGGCGGGGARGVGGVAGWGVPGLLLVLEVPCAPCPSPRPHAAPIPRAARWPPSVAGASSTSARPGSAVPRTLRGTTHRDPRVPSSTPRSSLRQQASATCVVSRALTSVTTSSLCPKADHRATAPTSAPSMQIHVTATRPSGRQPGGVPVRASAGDWRPNRRRSDAQLCSRCAPARGIGSLTQQRRPFLVSPEVA